jgi:NAD(P)-dependent dehydrogenase (short-subunit alcohol dehydrogenase family)
VFDRDAGKGQAVAGAIGGQFFACDVADAAGAERAVADAVAALGAPAVLVNCAGIGTAARIVGRDGPMPLETFEQVVRVNLIGTFNMMRLVAAAMSVAEPDGNGQRGVIVSTASVAAYEGQIGQAAYAASKGGIVALTLPAAREFARFGIRVLAIAPGLFLTPLLDELPDETKHALGSSIPNPQRLGRPEEFAALVLSMVGNDYLNGEVVRLDGALRMAPK